MLVAIGLLLVALAVSAANAWRMVFRVRELQARLAAKEAELAAAGSELAATREELGCLKESRQGRSLPGFYSAHSGGTCTSAGRPATTDLAAGQVPDPDLLALQQEAQHKLALLTWESEGGRVPDCREEHEGFGETGYGVPEQGQTKSEGKVVDNLRIEPDEHDEHAENNLDHLWFDIGGEG